MDCARWAAMRCPVASSALRPGSGPSAALIEQFERLLAAHDSATAALREWCARRGLGTALRADVLDRTVPQPAAEMRAMLGLSSDQPLGFRLVRLRCGDLILSEARNWYAAGRLSAAMNHALDHSAVPFGEVAAPLGFRRERLDTQAGTARPCPPGTIVAHRALLRLPDGQPLAYLEECYASGILGAA